MSGTGLSVPPGPVPGFAGLAAAQGRGELDKSFGTLTLVGDTSGFPWRMNAKIVSRYLTTSGTSVYTSCSGTLIDAETALTAAHCVYLHNETGDEIWDWAQEVWVYPGWDGVGGQQEPPSTVNPFGFGHSTLYQAGSGWINNGTTDDDVAVVRLTRAAGILTGWYGYSYGGNCAYYQTTTQYNASYPGEPCGEPGLYDGTDMYWWYGTVDSCPDNQLELVTAGTCENGGWGGMSGSSMYYPDGTDRYAHAVASTADNVEQWIRFCRITQTWAGYIGSFIADSRGSVFDLQPMEMIVDGVVTAGELLPTGTFRAVNATNVSASGTYTYRVYLSENDYISPANDILIGTETFTAPFYPLDAITVFLGQCVIPIDVPTSIRWVGVELDAGTDPDPSNNATHGWDAQQITVWGRPDLSVVQVASSGGTLGPGDSVLVTWQVTNQGGDPAGPITLEIRLSTDTVISDADPLIATVTRASLGASSTWIDYEVVQVACGVPAGDYNLGIRVLTGNDPDPDNDTGVSPTGVTMSFLFCDGFETGDDSGWNTAVP